VKRWRLEVVARVRAAEVREAARALAEAVGSFDDASARCAALGTAARAWRAAAREGRLGDDGHATGREGGSDPGRLLRAASFRARAGVEARALDRRGEEAARALVRAEAKVAVSRQTLEEGRAGRDALERRRRSWRARCRVADAAAAEREAEEWPSAAPLPGP